MIIKIVLGIVLLVSLITDIKDRKILNIITLPAIFFAFMYFVSIQGWKGFLFSFEGFLLGFVFLLIPYLLGGMGAGDVKLMAAIGALTGPIFVTQAFVYIALIGGLISIILILKKRGVLNSAKSLFINIVYFRMNLGSLILNKDKYNSISFPYGVAIFAGTICAYIWGGL